MEKRVVATTKAPAAVGPYVQGMVVGDFFYGSGQLGLIPESGQLAEGIEAQTRQALANVDAVLQEAGFARGDVVKANIFLADIRDFAVVNEIYAGFFGESFPARSCVEAANLPKGGLVEIEVVAAK